MITSKFRASIVTFAFSSLLLTSSTSIAAEVEGIDDNDHAALAKHYEDHAKSEQILLEHHQEIVEEYANHSYYFGPEGLSEHSHAKANVREHEAAVEAALEKAKMHRELAETASNEEKTADAQKALQ
ncbi:hypothetical protein W03_07680 [Nitrosomonas sp. PY1]|uniref:hypothetical protein n=1 Tax=Nitrosomonas sp. PY1 TaxID=1803906 RepID=UPI001FC880DB|nr:hypothetical protein [Nitrosomonas sp. PY1]GKS68764.1 hypothetical protein W03_07680 [Nitrosomonas sp. PY1]